MKPLRIISSIHIPFCKTRKSFALLLSSLLLLQTHSSLYAQKVNSGSNSKREFTHVTRKKNKKENGELP